VRNLKTNFLLVGSSNLERERLFDFYEV